jgi:hypothetical protein
MAFGSTVVVVTSVTTVVVVGTIWSSADDVELPPFNAKPTTPSATTQATTRMARRVRGSWGGWGMRSERKAADSTGTFLR